MIPFPSTYLTIRQAQNGKLEVLDKLRQQYVTLTPEEEVRQSIIAYLIHEKAYPKGVIAVEYSFRLNGMQKRADIVVFSKTGHPALLIECKAPHIALSQKILNQASRYNQVIQASLVCLCNGVSTLIFTLNAETNTYEILNTLPDYNTL